MINTEQLVLILKDVANDYEKELYSVVEKKLSNQRLYRERRILKRVFKLYENEENRRWWDPYHVLFSTLFTIVESTKNRNLTSLIIPAIILHDIGYSAITSKEEWDRPESRIIHMWKGAALAVDILCEVKGYKTCEVYKIAEMVATHDNPYVGIKLTPANHDVHAVRNADRAWVMHFLSFYKDWASKAKEEPNLKPDELLRLRLAEFYKINRLPENLQAINSIHVSGAKLKKYKNKYVLEPQLTDLAKSWVEAQFRSRHQEITDKIMDDLSGFEQYAREHIKMEIQKMFSL